MSQSLYIAKSAYGPVKIGVAKDIRIRLSNIQISSPVDVTLEYAANCDGDMRAVEQRAQRRNSALSLWKAGKGKCECNHRA